MTKQPKYPQPWLLNVTILQGNVLRENNTSGALCISQAWPGMARTIYKDHKRFLETYLTPYPGKETLWQVTAEVFGLVRLGLPAGFLHRAGLGRAGTVASFFYTPHGVEGLHLSLPETSSLPWE